MIGKALGHYQVIEKLGEGGMGIVYKARDTHLDRFVAIKVLQPEKVADPDRKRRFVQEAKAASALNHPNIVTIHDITHEGGTDFIVMEHIEGKTLDQRIRHRGLRLTDALKYAVQIADALAKAHSAGIVHRDLKPTNIMVNEDGVAKVLDFGLAKLTEQIECEENASTATVDDEGRSITEEGVIVGTVAYMSPEQAEGKKVDARSDIFSFGSVLYEMVTGQKAFQGTSRMSTLSAILHQEPKPVSGITPAIPTDLEKLINRCLRKDPTRRFQYMADVKVALDELKEDSDLGRLQAAPAKTRQLTPVRLLIVAVAVVAVVAGWYWLSRPRPTEPEATLTAVPLTSYPGMEMAPSFSPDGTQVAFVWRRDLARQECNIYIKQIDVEPPFRLTATPASDFSPAWSPDGATIAFLRFMPPDALSVIVVPQRGGPERVLAEFRSQEASRLVGYGEAHCLAWTPDSKWLVSIEPLPKPPPHWALVLLSLDTRERRKLTDPPPGVWGDIGPAVSPDGRTLVFSRDINSGTLADLYLLSLSAGYVAQGMPERLPSNNPRSLSPTWTPDGREIVFASRTGTSGLGLWRTAVTQRTRSSKLAVGASTAFAPAISRRLNRLAYAENTYDTNIWQIDLEVAEGRQPAPVPLIASTQSEWNPSFSPDGKKIAYASARSGTGEVWVCDSDGSNPVRLTSLGGPMPIKPSWSWDGQKIAFWVNATVPEGYIVDVNGGVPRRLPGPPGGVKHPSWSRDGAWLYFCTKPSGIWKMRSEGGGAVQISEKGDMPQESPDGKFIYYSDGWPSPLTVWRIPVGGGLENKILDSVNPSSLWTVAPDGIYHFGVADNNGHSELQLYEFASGKVRRLFTIEHRLAHGLSISPDGRKILYTQIDESGSDLMLVENFR